MKKFLLVLIVVSFVVSGCTSSIERKASKEMKRKMTEVAKIPESVKITNVKTAYVDDSLCILHYDFAGKNSYGAVVKNRYEFVYLIHDDYGVGSVLAYYHDLEDDKSVIELAKEDFKENELRFSEELKDKKKREENKKLCLKQEAYLQCWLNGYEVGEKDNDSEYDISNW
ncbi:MAG: hypothetical protein K6F96_02835 [Bacteroidales bacterium]|nr:hypothetical protein [Bacteroidales bacterium]